MSVEGRGRSESNTWVTLYQFLIYRIYSADFKMETYLKIAQLYLEEQNHVSAEAYINRAALLQSETKNKELQTIYKVYVCDVHILLCHGMTSWKMSCEILEITA